MEQPATEGSQRLQRLRLRSRIQALAYCAGRMEGHRSPCFQRRQSRTKSQWQPHPGYGRQRVRDHATGQRGNCLRRPRMWHSVRVVSDECEYLDSIHSAHLYRRRRWRNSRTWLDALGRNSLRHNGGGRQSQLWRQHRMWHCVPTCISIGRMAANHYLRIHRRNRPGKSYLRRAPRCQWKPLRRDIVRRNKRLGHDVPDSSVSRRVTCFAMYAPLGEPRPPDAPVAQRFNERKRPEDAR
jgi:hypothetical protein